MVSDVRTKIKVIGAHVSLAAFQQLAHTILQLSISLGMTKTGTGRSLTNLSCLLFTQLKKQENAFNGWNAFNARNAKNARDSENAWNFQNAWECMGFDELDELDELDEFVELDEFDECIPCIWICQGWGLTRLQR